MTSRWKQHYDSFIRELARLELYAKKEAFTELEKPGFIKTFESVCQRALHTIRFYKIPNSGSIPKALRLGGKNTVLWAFQQGLIRDDETWLRLVEDRNRTAHFYSQKRATSVAKRIRNEYITLFRELAETLKPAFDQETDIPHQGELKQYQGELNQ